MIIAPLKMLNALIVLLLLFCGITFAEEYAGEHSTHNQQLEKVFSENELEFIKNNPVIRATQFFEEPPFTINTPDLKSGYLYELIQLLLNPLGISIEYIDGYNSYDEMLQSLDRGQVDILTTIDNAYPLPANSQIVTSKPVLITPYVLVGRLDSSTINGTKELFSKHVAVVKGYAQDKLLDRYPEIIKVHVKDNEAGFKALRQRKAEYFLNNKANAEHEVYKKFATDLSLKGELSYQDFPPLTISYGLNRALPELGSIIEKSLENLPISTLKSLKNKWLESESINKTVKIPLSNEEQAFIKNHPNIQLGIDATWEPLIIPDGKGGIKGFEVEILEKIKKLTGLNITIKTGKWSKIVDQAKNLEIDGLMASAPSKERAKYFLFSKPYNPLNFVVITSQGNPHNLKKPEDIQGMKLVVQKGNLINYKLAKKFTGLEPLLADSYGEIFDIIMRGEAKAGLSAEQVWYKIAKDNNRHILPVFALPERTDILYSIRRDWPELKSILDKAISAIPEKEMVELKNKWFLIQSLDSVAKKQPTIKLTQEEIAWLQKHPVIRVSNELDYPPFDFAIGNKPQGYSVELLHLIAKRIGIQLQFVNGYTWDELWKMFERKELDLVQPVYRNKYREQFGFFSKQLYSGKTVFITRSDQPKIRTIDDLMGKTVAAPKGWATTHYFQKHYPGIKLLITNNHEESLDAVTHYKAYATFEIDAVAYYMLNKGMYNELRVNGWFREFDDNFPNNFFFLSRKDWPILHQLITKAQNSITPKEIQELQNKWFPVSERIVMDSLDNSITLSPEEQQYLKHREAIKLCSSPGWPPLEWIDENGQHRGLAADFIKLISTRIDHPIKFFPAKNWNQTIDNIKSKKCDFISAIVKSEQRGQYLNFTDVLQQLDVVIATRKEQIYIQDMSTLSGKKVGVVKNSIFESLLKQHYPFVEIESVDDMLSGLRRVENGEIIGFIDNMISLAYAIQQNALIDLKISGRVGEPIQLRMGVRKDEPILYQILNRALNSISLKERQELASKWINVKLEQATDYTLVWQLSIAALIILTSFIYWNRKLATFNQKISVAHEALAETQKIARLGSWEFDVTKQKISWSDEVFRIAGMEVREQAPAFEEYLEKVHPDDRGKLHENLEKALKGESYEVELRHLLPDGSYNYTLTRAKPETIDGQVTKVKGSVLDLTKLRQTELSLKEEIQQRLAYEVSLHQQIIERQRVEEALRESEHQLRLITDHTPAYIAYVDMETMQYLFVNQMFVNAYNKQRKDIIGHHIKEIIGQANFEYALPYIEEAKQGKSVTYVNTFKIETGKRWINVHYEPDFDENGKVQALFVLSHDITERMQFEEDLSQAKEIAEQANQTKSEFIANMSHEIRTPLNAVLGFSELLEQTDINSVQKNYLRSIHTGGKTLLSLINDILDLSKIEAGKMAIEKEPVFIHQIFADIAQIFSFKIKEKGLDMQLVIDDSLPELLILDEARLRQVLLNIVGNAVKFTHSGRVEISVHGSPCAHSNNAIQLMISVKDTGIGIPLEQQEKVFESFVQQQGQSNQQYEGTGLGLPISKKLVELMDGEIIVDSHPDTGSTFTIHLHKIFTSSKPHSKKTLLGDTGTDLVFDPATIIIADDVESNRELVKSVLQKRGIKVVEATDGAQALMLATEIKPELIIMDIRMPVMDGIDATKKIQATPELSTVPIIALTASPKLSENKNIFQGFLEKPVTSAMIINELKRHLAYQLNEQQLSFPSNLSYRELLQQKNVSDVIDKNIKAHWQTAIESGIFSDAEKFAGLLKQTGKEYQLKVLIDYAEAIKEAAQSFEVKQLRELLKDFELLAIQE